MKKFIIVLIATFGLLSLSAYQSKAQNAAAFSQTVTNPTGNITDAAIDTATYTLSRPALTVSVQPKYVRNTGTAAGTVVLDYSLDGVTWAVANKSFTLTNVASQGTVWDLTTAARYFRIRASGATTVTATVSAKITVYS